jgi:hypothetical protein
MTQRTIIILAAVLALLVLVILVSQRSDTGSGAAPGLLVPGLSDRLDDVDSVMVSKAGGEVVATLRRSESGWVVAERNDFPANVTRLRAGLVALAEARRIEQKTANPDFYDRLGVSAIENADASGILVSLGGLAEPVQVIIGDAAGSDYRYVRLNSDATSWLIDRDPELPRATGEWLVTDLLDVNGDRVQSITVQHPDGARVKVSKADADQPDFTVEAIPSGRELLYAGVANAMGDVLEELQLEDVESAQSGSGDSNIVTEFRTFDGLVITATAVEREDSTWVSFAADFDPAQAEAFTRPPEAEDGDDAASDGEAALPTVDQDMASQAGQLNERLAGWRFKIPRFKFEQMTRSMADLLQAPADDA